MGFAEHSELQKCQANSEAIGRGSGFIARGWESSSAKALAQSPTGGRGWSWRFGWVSQANCPFKRAKLLKSIIGQSMHLPIRLHVLDSWVLPIHTGSSLDLFCHLWHIGSTLMCYSGFHPW
jgi:hypothetical protein